MPMGNSHVQPDMCLKRRRGRRRTAGPQGERNPALPTAVGKDLGGRLTTQLHWFKFGPDKNNREDLWQRGQRIGGRTQPFGSKTPEGEKKKKPGYVTTREGPTISRMGRT